MACNVRILILFWAILSIFVGACILYSNAFWFCNNTGRRKAPFHVSIELMIGLGTASLGWTVKQRRRLLVHITLDKVSVFPVSIPPEDLPSKKTLAMMMAWVRKLCGLQVLHRVNWLCFPSFYSNIYDLAYSQNSQVRAKYKITRFSVVTWARVSRCVKLRLDGNCK